MDERNIPDTLDRTLFEKKYAVCFVVKPRLKNVIGGLSRSE